MSDGVAGPAVAVVDRVMIGNPNQLVKLYIFDVLSKKIYQRKEATVSLQGPACQ